LEQASGYSCIIAEIPLLEPLCQVGTTARAFVIHVVLEGSHALCADSAHALEDHWVVRRVRLRILEVIINDINAEICIANVSVAGSFSTTVYSYRSRLLERLSFDADPDLGPRLVRYGLLKVTYGFDITLLVQYVLE
jgi:hypothetical protein